MKTKQMYFVRFHIKINQKEKRILTGSLNVFISISALLTISISKTKEFIKCKLGEDYFYLYISF